MGNRNQRIKGEKGKLTVQVFVAAVNHQLITYCTIDFSTQSLFTTVDTIGVVEVIFPGSELVDEILRLVYSKLFRR